MIKLILEKDVKNLGKAGDKVSVRPGYARNWLLPKKLALTLNEKRLAEWRHKQALIEVRKRKAEEGREKILKQLSHIHLVFEKEAAESGALFGSLTAAEISRALEEKHQLSVDKKDILQEPLKIIGKHKVKVALSPKQEAYLTITLKKAARAKEEAPPAPSMDDEEMEEENFVAASQSAPQKADQGIAQTDKKALGAAQAQTAAQAKKKPPKESRAKSAPAGPKKDEALPEELEEPLKKAKKAPEKAAESKAEKAPPSKKASKDPALKAETAKAHDGKAAAAPSKNGGQKKALKAEAKSEARPGAANEAAKAQKQDGKNTKP